jgi:hypothetical protein
MQCMDIMKDTALKPLWKRGFGNELGRLFQGNRDIQGANTCFFVKLTNILKDIKITIPRNQLPFRRGTKVTS